MHYVQNSILSLLAEQKEARYSSLRPKGVESNLFSYHLRALQRSGYVAKTPSGHYTLAAKGKLYVDQLNPDSLVQRAQAKIIVLLAVHNNSGQYLLYRRKRQPFIGFVGFPYAKINLGERVAGAAYRQLNSEMMLECELEHVGDGYITSFEGGDLVSEVFFHLFAGSNPIGYPPSELVYGECMWRDITPEKDMDLLPGVEELYKKLTNSEKGFFLEIQKYL